MYCFSRICALNSGCQRERGGMTGPRFSLCHKWAKLAAPLPDGISVLPFFRCRAVVLVTLTLSLQACTAIPVAPTDTGVKRTPGSAAAAGEAPAAVAADLPELQLNLPDQSHCNCVPAAAASAEDNTFLEKGYEALLDGEYEDAMQHFQRYRRLESSPRADLEAGIAIAYLRMLPRGPYYDPVVARDSFRALREQNAKKLQVHDYVRLMRLSLLNLLEQQQTTEKFRASNATLKEDLKKREEALKRLRDLTLSQKGAAQ
jgi:hypothetical protein